MLPSFRPACSPFKEQQLKQFRAQCIIFLALRNKKEPQKLHLDVALAGFPAQAWIHWVDGQASAAADQEIAVRPTVAVLPLIEER
ncbi:hypothetical protein E2562_017350 [Oryza meyeriana var. granulata]|uniref:Uncharacterized protein n=1 Tax=Oryza meyeriana var. granulata TaxID=110450 RepID=A0A6G1D4Y7_9ORYZ|nr:hypothetical protein E2562_017350 [Oryza meyeriana var. granulata]